VALGCPQGDDPAAGTTATVGIVSATRRLRATAPEGRRQGTALQVSARLNYGNNGGPIVSMDGTLLAIAAHCTHDRTDPNARKGFNSGVGFATPAARLRELLPRLRAGETLDRRETPFLGVRTATDPRGQGVRIMELVKGAPAGKSGLRVGDIIIMAGDTRVESSIDLRFAIQEMDVGDPLEIVVLRGPDRARKEFTIVLGARPRTPRRR
jgi:S1-C subfamily serine protease